MTKKVKLTAVKTDNASCRGCIFAQQTDRLNDISPCALLDALGNELGELDCVVSGDKYSLIHWHLEEVDSLPLVP